LRLIIISNNRHDFLKQPFNISLFEFCIVAGQGRDTVKEKEKVGAQCMRGVLGQREVLGQVQQVDLEAGRVL
jgi:hypothetical protein